MLNLLRKQRVVNFFVQEYNSTKQSAIKLKDFDKDWVSKVLIKSTIRFDLTLKEAEIYFIIFLKHLGKQ